MTEGMSEGELRGVDEARLDMHGSAPSLSQPPPILAAPFSRYPDGGNVLLGVPAWGTGSSRTGYGVPVFAACG